MISYRRLDLQSLDMDILQGVINSYLDNGGIISDETLKSFRAIKTINVSVEKRFATDKANDIRTLNAKKKIFDAVLGLIRMI